MRPLDSIAHDQDPAPQAEPPASVLIVDDEPGIVESLTKIFQREGLHVLSATDGATGLDMLRRHRVGVLITDLMMPRTTGMDLLRAAKTVAPETEVVLMTAYGTVENAVEAMKEGAYDFVTKPLKRAHVVRIVRNALEKQSLVIENRALRAQLAEKRRRRPARGKTRRRRQHHARQCHCPAAGGRFLLVHVVPVHGGGPCRRHHQGCPHRPAKRTFCAAGPDG